MNDELKLLPCPFCGGEPKMAEFDGNVGGGDYQKIFAVWCENSQCSVKPRCNVLGEHGYRRPEDLDNASARSKSIAAWNRRLTPEQSGEARDTMDVSLVMVGGKLRLHGYAFHGEWKAGNYCLLPWVESDARDAAMFRWLLDGNGYFMEEHCLCGHAPCSDEEKDDARKEIRAAMDRSALGEK